MKIMKTNRVMLVGLSVALFGAAVLQAAGADQWIHIKVDSKSGDEERVRVNVPLSFAEKILPTIQADCLHNGKVKIEGEMNGVDLHALMDAIRSTGDSEFVTVESKHEHVRVAKQGAYMVIKVRDEDSGSKKTDKAETVDVKVPLSVVEALLSGGKNELDLTAAVRALRAQGDTELVSVNDGEETVRIWVDSQNTSE
ncbi:MAG: hypothetical protein ACLQOO_37000 [Terriglobia bacterium]